MPEEFPSRASTCEFFTTVAFSARLRVQRLQQIGRAVASHVFLNYLDLFRGSTGQVLFMSWPKLDVASSSVLGRSTLGGGGYCASTWKMQNSRISPKLNDSSSFINFPCDIW